MGIPPEVQLDSAANCTEFRPVRVVASITWNTSSRARLGPAAPTGHTFGDKIQIGYRSGEICAENGLVNGMGHTGLALFR